MLLIGLQSRTQLPWQQAMWSNVGDGACRVLEAAGALRPGFVSGLAAPSRPAAGSVISSAHTAVQNMCLAL